MGAALASNADGSGAGVTSCARGAAVGTGCGFFGAAVGAALGFGTGAAVGGALMFAAMTVAGIAVATAGGIVAGVTAISACVGTGFGASELSGAGVGFGGPFGLFFASSCSTRGCCGADRGCAAGVGRGCTGACGGGTATCCGCCGAGFCGVARLTVTISPPANDSGAACSDDDVAMEKKKYAKIACKSSDAKKLAAKRSGRRRSR